MSVFPAPLEVERQSPRRVANSVWDDRIELVSLLLWAVPILFVLGALLYRGTMFVSRNYNEGWNAYQATAILDGTALYHPAGSLLTNNYPPGSFLVVAMVMHLVPDAIFAGRLVAGLSFLAIAWLIVAVLHRIDGDVRACLVGGLVFITYACVNFSDYIGVDDPQFLSLAVILLGLYLQIRFLTVRWSALFSALIVTVGLFIKHNTIALPITMAIWLLIQFPLAGARFVLSGGIFALGGLVLCTRLLGPDFLTGLLAPRQYAISRALRQSLELITPMKALIILAGIPAFLSGRDRFALLFGAYIAISLAVGCIVSGGDGVASNSVFELAIALSLAVGHLVARLRVHARGWQRAVALAGIAIAAIWSVDLYSTKDIFAFKTWRAQQFSREAGTLAAIHFIAAHPGRALCTNLVLCYWSGKSHEVDPYNFNQAIIAGKVDESILIDAIKRREYATIELYPVGGYSFFSPAVWAVVRRTYDQVPIEVAGSAIFVRRSSPSSSDN